MSGNVGYKPPTGTTTQPSPNLNYFPQNTQATSSTQEPNPNYPPKPNTANQPANQYPNSQASSVNASMSNSNMAFSSYQYPSNQQPQQGPSPPSQAYSSPSQSQNPNYMNTTVTPAIPETQASAQLNPNQPQSENKKSKVVSKQPAQPRPPKPLVMKQGVKKTNPGMALFTQFRKNCAASPQTIDGRVVIPWDHSNQNFVYSQYSNQYGNDFPMQEVVSSVSNSTTDDNIWNPVKKYQWCVPIFIIWTILVITAVILAILVFPVSIGIKGLEWVPVLAGAFLLGFGAVLLLCCVKGADRLSAKKYELMYSSLKQIEDQKLAAKGLGVRPGKHAAWIELGSREKLIKAAPVNLISPIAPPQQQAAQPPYSTLTNPQQPSSTSTTTSPTKQPQPTTAGVASSQAAWNNLPPQASMVDSSRSIGSNPSVTSPRSMAGSDRDVKSTYRPAAIPPAKIYEDGSIERIVKKHRSMYKYYDYCIVYPPGRRPTTIPAHIVPRAEVSAGAGVQKKQAPPNLNSSDLFASPQLSPRQDIATPVNYIKSPRNLSANKPPNSPRQQYFLDRLNLKKSGAQLPPFKYEGAALYNSVQPVEDIIFDPLKSINLLEPDQTNDDLI